MDNEQDTDMGALQDRIYELEAEVEELVEQLGQVKEELSSARFEVEDAGIEVERAREEAHDKMIRFIDDVGKAASLMQSLLDLGLDIPMDVENEMNWWIMDFKAKSMIP